MREAVIVASSRTAIGKSYRGSLNMTRPDDLAATCVKDILRKVPNLDPREIEDLILGCGQPHGAQSNNLGRQVALLAGLPAASIAATTITRHCSSGLQSVAMAAHQIVNEGVDAAIGAGVESISLVPAEADPHPYLYDKMPGFYFTMGQTAEVVAKRYKVSRQAQDEYALASQQRTARAQQEGFFSGEIVPMKVTMALCDKKSGQQVGTQEVCLDHDECNRPGATIEGLAALKPVFDTETGQGTVTAGNSSQLSDGAAANLLMSRQRADQLGIPYKLIYRGFAVSGCEPDEMGIGPVWVVPKLLKRHGLKIDDIDRWELNEAFAVQVVYCRDRLGLPMERLNVNGGSISIGHPYGMTGSRLAGTLANELSRNRKSRYGVVTMCVGGGMGAAGLFEAVH